MNSVPSDRITPGRGRTPLISLPGQVREPGSYLGGPRCVMKHDDRLTHCLSSPTHRHKCYFPGVGRYVGFTPMWERTICGIRAGELDISPVRGIANTRTRLHSYG